MEIRVTLEIDGTKYGALYDSNLTDYSDIANAVGWTIRNHLGLNHPAKMPVKVEN